MRRLTLLIFVCLASAGLSVAAGTAVAASSPTTNCTANDGVLTKHFSVAALEHALATMPAQVKEYTPCYQTIESQLQKQLASHLSSTGGSGGSGGSFLSTPLLIVLIVIVLGGGGFAYAAYRRNGTGGGPQAPTGEG